MTYSQNSSGYYRAPKRAIAIALVRNKFEQLAWEVVVASVLAVSVTAYFLV